MSAIAVVGSINLDLVYLCERIPEPGETLHSHGLSMSPGGKGANQAVASARSGGDVVIVGAVGSDAFAEPALAELRAAGVDLSHVARREGVATGTANIYVEDSGENSILLDSGANGTMDAEAVEAFADVVTSANVVLVQGEIPRSGTEAAARLCTGRLMVNLAPVIDVDHQVLLQADPLVVNEHEGALALQMLGADPADGDEAVVRALRSAGIPSVVMTRGPQGALIGLGDDVAQVPAPTITAVDTTGAGDAFVGALAQGLASGESMVDAAARAVRVASFACTRRGAQPSYPGPDDVLPGVVPTS